jgi:hypothetical protein
VTGRLVNGRLVTGRFVTGRYVTGRSVGVSYNEVINVAKERTKKINN